MSERLYKYNGLIVYQGVPFTLTQRIEGDIRNPCDACDLRYACGVDYGCYNFRDLCTPDPDDTSHFFVENWSIVGKQVIDFVVQPSDFELK